jgi:hypothetical protein
MIEQQAQPSICLSCGAELSPPLDRSGSLRCHDCRDAAAPICEALLAATEARLRLDEAA